MKPSCLKLYITCALSVLYLLSNAQNNNFPSSGNASIAADTLTHSLTMGSTATGIAQYNTTTMNTNYERGHMYWSSSVFTIGTEKGGTGSGRNLKLTTPNSRSFTIVDAGAVSGTFNFTHNTTSNTSGIGVTGTLSSSTGVQNPIAVLNTINQTSTGGYRGLWISPYEQGTGSGVKYLIDAGTNSAAAGAGTHTSLFTVDNTGVGFINKKFGVGISNPLGIFHAKSYWGNCDIIFETLSGIQWDLATNEDGSFSLYRPSTGAVPFMVTDGGNMLINKTSQTNTSYKLDVNGDARVNKLVVNTTGADFVFDPNYKVMPLHQLDQFVKQNKHLPGIEPAAQMQKDGVDVGGNQTKLLQKIEELTLYAIAQEKRQQEQTTLISSQADLLKQQQQLLLQLQKEVQELKAAKK